MKRTGFQIIVAAAVASSPAVAHGGAGEFRGPYLNDVTGDAVTVMWESPAATTGIVRYGVASVNEPRPDT